MKKQVSTKIGTVTPSIKGDWQFANLHECLPDYVCESLLEGMKAFGRKIKGMMQKMPFFRCRNKNIFPASHGKK